MSEILRNFLDNLVPWFYNHGLKILLIFAGAYFIRRFTGIFITKLVRKAVFSDHFLTKEAEQKREDTLIRVFNGVVIVLIWLIALLMILSEFGVSIAPLLAGAGVVGVAIGFGAQYVVRDFVTGLFLILENQYRVGDVVCVGTTCGVVETINLRMTILRDLDGVAHHIPNGEIKSASNLSKHFARVNLNVGVSYQSDLEKVIKVVNQVGQDLASDSKWKDVITDPPKFLRVDDFADSAVVIKILGETKPLQQWDVTGELRKRIKIAFDKEGIEIPYPQRVVHQVQ